jgi:hypothetical protein
LLNICVEKCANSKRLWKLAKENGNISLEMQAKVYESRLQKLENEQDNFNIMKQRITAVIFRLKEIVQPHENHCRCRTELKLRPPLQRTIQYNTNLLLSIMTPNILSRTIK